MAERNLSLELESALPTLTKAVFSQPIDKTADARLTVRPLTLRGERRYQVERQRGAQAFHENLDGEGQLVQKQHAVVGEGNLTGGERPAAAGHDRAKSYLLAEGENVPALVDLGVFTPEFKIVKARYDKYKQINRFLELIDQAFADSQRDEITILDFGCGKSYLTFILYYYFSVKRGMKVTILGYDLKADVVERCGQIAEKYGYTGLRFVHADVSRDVLYDQRVDMVVTLHACDTATDYALRYAIEKGADYIFSVPCCQHEINTSIRRGGDLDLLLGHGILKERLSALLTDAIRGKVLEDMGYKVDMIEFTDFENSPKNLMIRARRTGRRSTKGRAGARALAEKYGFTQTLLELCKEE